MVVEQQRTRLLTSTQLLNMIRAVTDDAEADAVVNEAIFQVTSDLQMRFPPARYESRRTIPNSTEMSYFIPRPPRRQIRVRPFRNPDDVRGAGH